MRVAAWLWNKGIVSTFLTGLFVVLPLAITVAILAWVGNIAKDIAGPGSPLGSALETVGLQFVTNEAVASIVGWILAILAIWLLGVATMATARYRLEGAFHWAVNSIPIVKNVYGPVSQVVGMLKQQDKSEIKGMSVVYCTFGEAFGSGFLAFLTSQDTYRFHGEDCHIVYIPTSPVPMSGGIVFVPVKSVHHVDMSVDSLMQIYFSLGVMASSVVPKAYHVDTPKT